MQKAPKERKTSVLESSSPKSNRLGTKTLKRASIHTGFTNSMENALALTESLLPFNEESFKKFVSFLVFGFSDEKALLVTKEISLTIFQDMTLDQLLESAVLVAAQNIQNDIDYDKIAVRIFLIAIYKSAIKIKNIDDTFAKNYENSFIHYIHFAVSEKLLDKNMESLFDLQKLSSHLALERDDIYKYIGISTALNRYMIKDRTQNPLETPQFMWMRIAMGMSLKESDPTAQALVFYSKLSNLEYIPGGSTNIGAGTTYPALSNCYLLDTEDDINSIFENVKHVALISKGTGGIGLSITKLRAEGSPIKTNNTFSSGPIPFSHIMDSTIRAISRAGKKMGALCLYMENWHINFPEFLDLKKNSGDDYRRTKTANTAVYISDEFMKRVERDDDWYMFDPAEVADLPELYGKEFSKRYAEYVNLAKQGKMYMYTVTKAREQMKQIIVNLQENSHPWITWKDTINVRALNNNTGTIHCSNLCTEVVLPQDKNNIAVCNLLYINLISHFTMTGAGADLDWEKLGESVKMGIRHLDNLIDVGFTPVKEARHSDLTNRAVGLGIMGFAETLERFGYSYDSAEAYDLIDKTIEFISYHSIDASCELADERGVYENFPGSMWSKGFVPFDTIAKLEEARGERIYQNRNSSLDWNKLRTRVAKGIRNATVMMIAPNASTGLLAGTTPGLDPRFAQIFSRATNRGKFLDINHNMVQDLKNLGLWDSLKDEILTRYGDISEFIEIPDHLKAIYKTCFQIDAKSFIEVASRAQKWIDQSISRNMYLETRDIDETMNVYVEAWRRGLKTTYYLHMKPKSQSEQSTVHVNKGASIGKKGFGLVQALPSVQIPSTIQACPLDPQEREACESCQ